MTRDRTRLALVAVAGINVAIVASITGRIFDALYTPLYAVGGALLATAVAAVDRAQRIWVRVLAQFSVCVVATALAVRSRHGDLPGDLVGSFTRGLGRVIAVRWPAPSEPISVGAVVLAATATAAIAVELAWSRRYAALPLVPPIALIILIAVLAPQAGPAPLWSMVAVTACSAVLLRLAFIARTEKRHSQAAGAENGALALVASVIGLVAILPAAVGAPFGASDRFDVRELRKESSTIDPEISPLSRLDEWRSLSPARTMFTVSPADPNGRWRFVALTRYDGRAWMPSSDFRPVGEQLAVLPRGAAEQRYRVTIDDFDEAWVPYVGEPLATNLAVRVDPTVSGIRVASRFSTGDRYRLGVVDREPTPAELQSAIADYRADLPSYADGVASIDPDLQTLASRWVEGATTDFQRATELATHLATEYQLDQKTAAGHSLPQLRLFLTATKAGRDEQFVAAYALLARAIGLPVRIAVGVELTADGSDSEASTANVTAWPEVAFQKYGWVAFDPLPDQLAAPPSVEPTGNPVGAAGEAAPPPTTAANPLETRPTDPPPPVEVGSGSLSVAGRFFLVGVLLLLAVLAYVATVLTMKRNRRLRRAQAMRADERIAGAFFDSIDVAVDLGAVAEPALTNRELVAASRAVVGRGGEPLDELARLATRATYAPEEPGPEAVEAAWQHARQVASETARSTGRVRWVRARISLRSLRLDGLGPASGGGRRRRRRR